MRCCCNDPTSKRLSPSIANLFPDRSPVSFILETILIPFPIQTIFNRIKFENASKIYQGRRSEKKGGKESSRLIRNIPLTNQSDVRKRRRKEDRWRIHKISRARNPRKGGANNACKHAQTGEESRMHRGCIESAPFGEHFVSLEDPTLVPRGSETDNSWRVVRGRSEGGWGIADKFLERFRRLEEALDVRKAASKDRWACLPVRSCLNFKVRRWGRP